MNKNTRLSQFLGELRRQMNGAVSSSMRYYGKKYGLNYGVSLPTIRTLAQQNGKDHSFAKYLYIQDIRELKIAAYHIAEVEQIELEGLEFWANGIINSELAEEFAQFILSQSPLCVAIAREWSVANNEILHYCALMGMARHNECSANDIREITVNIMHQKPSQRIVAQGIVALLDSAINSNIATIEEIKTILSDIPTTDVSPYINDEMGWRLEID